jgi:hypothetical protein
VAAWSEDYGRPFKGLHPDLKGKKSLESQQGFFYGSPETSISELRAAGTEGRSETIIM